MVKDYKSGALHPFDFKKLLEHIPELTQLGCLIYAHSFKYPIDSSNMDVNHWVLIAEIIGKNYHDYNGFVVLHGSDTMSYTASALSFMLENLAKPVIFTGSQLPIGDLRTDAKENLITSIQIAAMQEGGRPVVQEVGLYFEYKLLRGNRTTKINAEHFEAFASMNYPPLIESGVHLKVRQENLLRPSVKKAFRVHTAMYANIAILKLFPGLQRVLFDTILATPGIRALILETYGSGNAPTHEWLSTGIRFAIQKGVQIINVTQCSGGSVIAGKYETSAHLEKLQVINGADITTESAIAKARYLLGNQVSYAMFKTAFETSLRGEML